MLERMIPRAGRYLSLLENCIKNLNTRCTIATTASRLDRVEDRKAMLKSMPTPDEGTSGERLTDIDSIIQEKSEVFPTIGYLKKTFEGVLYTELPIVNIKVSPNNTLMNLTNWKGVPKLSRSCGIDGFKHTRKGTNIAAQTTAIAFAGKVLETGVKTVRVKIRGIGPGRMSSIKGLQMAGLNIVSVTDFTPVSWNPPRPRKAKKL